ncbi:MAG: methyltransferase domain-containing protein [Ruminococcaceae bacterium]|nr:methyltransferase domain-containing protein [Oscillospiraceae bacterium]
MPENRGRNLPYSVSQNFLTSSGLIHKLLRRSDLSSSDTVLEIGAGKGHITRALAARVGRVIAYEIDPRFAERLRGSLPGNVTLYVQDFLQCRLPRQEYCVFANIPFSITTAIVRKLALGTNPPRAMWLIMEKGAARRLSGSPRHNVLSLLIAANYDLRIVHRFQREDFHPAPRVDVVMLEFRRRKVCDVRPEEFPAFAFFVKHSFEHGLFSSCSLLTHRQIRTALKREGLSQIEPGGEVRYIQWLCLFRCWRRYCRP